MKCWWCGAPLAWLADEGIEVAGGRLTCDRSGATVVVCDGCPSPTHVALAQGVIKFEVTP